MLLSSHLLAQAQEICDRIGILANGALVREGRLDELIAIEHQTELILENASDALLAMKHNLLAMSDGTLTERQKEDEEEEVQRTKARKRRRAA